MPHTLLLDYQPLPVLHERRRRTGPAALLAVADAALRRLLTLWRGLFRDVRQAVRHRALVQALGVHGLEGRNYLAQLWEQRVEQPVRRLLGALGAEVMTEAGDVATPTLSRLARQPVAVRPELDASQQALAQYIGTQLRDITQGSLQTVQRVIRDGQQAQQSVETIARSLEQVLGLTPRQYQALQAMRQRFVAQGKPAREITRLLDQAIRQGLQRRALTIARTESVRLAHLGAHQQTLAAVQAGMLDVERIQRYWQTAPGACPDLCAPIPGMNPEGVGLDEAFQTPSGPMLLPPSHPNCRCSVITRLRDI